MKLAATKFLLMALAAVDLVDADVVLGKKIIDLALTCAELSSLAYEEDPPSDGFAHFGFYDDGKCCTVRQHTTNFVKDSFDEFFILMMARLII
jgi:hypothetical protein